MRCRRGIYFNTCMENHVSKNTISKHDLDGVVLLSCYDFTIDENTFDSNKYFSINIPSGGRHEIYHNNFFNNSLESYAPESQCYDMGTSDWNSTMIMEGNYWDDFDEPGEGAFDTDSNGIVDSPYDVLPFTRNADLYPFMIPNGWI